MIKKIKKIVLVFASFSVLLSPALAMSAASADTTTEICNGIAATGSKPANTGQTNLNPTHQPNDCGGPTSSDNTIYNILLTVVNIFSVIVGIVAVVMIIYGGFRYITSGGESTNVSNAKNAILYAIIGLVIVALAQIIVRYVVNRALGAYQPPPHS
jgi:Type IV secretion system pilin